jgi:uncharacterized membrane protein YsdA (DUF1294 family)/cold shock CspA family protein
MKKTGTVVRWDSARAFGFIRGAQPGADLFFHVRDVRGAASNFLREGLEVEFDEIHAGRKGPRAVAVYLLSNAGSRGAVPARDARARSAHLAPSSGAALALPLMLAYAGALVWGVMVHRVPWWALALSPVLSLLTFFAYWQDKWAAGAGKWRIKEDTLHVWSLAGGWPGAWFAQQVLRHKSRKESFREGYWMTVLLHCGAMAAWLYAAR